MSVEQLTEVYLSIRSAREALLRDYEAKDTELKTDLQAIERELLTVCNDINANSINTKFGTVIRSLKERFVCNDWDSFKQFVREHDLIDCLEKRIHQGNFKSFMEQHEGEGLPVGVNVMREYGVTVRKASN
jgi:hypothetical protein